jgi:hypothetical protein
MRALLMEFVKDLIPSAGSTVSTGDRADAGQALRCAQDDSLVLVSVRQSPSSTTSSGSPPT